MDDHTDFLNERSRRIESYKANTSFRTLSKQYLIETLRHEYSYNFSWMGLPVIQYPQDLVALQEIIFETKPDLIIETGVARGGSIIFYASMLELLGGNGIVIGIDIDIRSHNRKRVMEQALSHRIRLIEASSTELSTVDMVKAFCEGKQRIMVSLDSNHTHEHVRKELELYTPLVTPGCYCVVFDTVIEMMPEGSYPERPWDKGNNPMAAVENFLRNNSEFQIDSLLEEKLQITAAPFGWLQRKG
jgi:cephalosporin hydroxylase